MYRRDDPVNIYQVEPQLPRTRNSPTGLECLRMVDSLSVKQHTSLTEVVFGVASEAKFDIFNNRNERLFQALETSTFCQRLCCTSRRRFTLRIFDNQNQDIILIKREFKCCSGCCWCANSNCCSQELTAESPPGFVIGTVSQQASCCRGQFAIKDVDDNHVLTLLSPKVGCDGPLSCCCENKWMLLGSDGVSEVGAVYKKYRGFLAEAMTSADAYLLQVPMNLDVNMKAMSLAALFLIEYMYYSAVPSRDNNSSHNNHNNNY